MIMYLISDILNELHAKGIVVTRQAIDFIKQNKLKPETHYKQEQKGKVVKFTKRGRTAILKHYKIYQKKN